MKLLKSVTILACLAVVMSSCHRGGTGCPMNISAVETTEQNELDIVKFNVIEKKVVCLGE